MPTMGYFRANRYLLTMQNLSKIILLRVKARYLSSMFDHFKNKGDILFKFSAIPMYRVPCFKLAGSPGITVTTSPGLIKAMEFIISFCIKWNFFAVPFSFTEFLNKLF